MPTTAEEYQELVARLDKLSKEYAVLQAREQQKAEERDALAKELTAQGIDVKDPDAEIARLEGEIREHLSLATQQIDQFEQELGLVQRAKPAYVVPTTSQIKIEPSPTDIDV